MLPSLVSELGEAITVDQPAEKDHLELRSALSAQAMFCQSKISKITADMADIADPLYYASRLQTLKRKLQEDIDHQHNIEAVQREFGSVWALSGLISWAEGVLVGLGRGSGG